MNANVSGQGEMTPSDVDWTYLLYSSLSSSCSMTEHIDQSPPVRLARLKVFTRSACSRMVCQQSVAFPKLLLENDVETISLLTSARSCICDSKLFVAQTTSLL
jgi:hypothetical protein